MDQPLNSGGSQPSVAGAPQSITIPELLLQAIGSSLPGPGKLHVPHTAIGNIGGTLARFGGGMIEELLETLDAELLGNPRGTA